MRAGACEVRAALGLINTGMQTSRSRLAGWVYVTHLQPELYGCGVKIASVQGSRTFQNASVPSWHQSRVENR